MERTVLVSGSGAAGSVLAYWLRRFGFTPTVVERAPAPGGGAGGHGTDLYGAAIDVVDRMGLLSQVLDASPGIETWRMFFGRRRRPVDFPYDLMNEPTVLRHIDVMRDDLVEILHGAVGDDIEHLFGDSITAIDDDGAGVDVTFAHAAPRRFDLVVGADGQHSRVRALAFGPEADYRHHLGGYLATFTGPAGDQTAGQLTYHTAVDRLVYSLRHADRTRVMVMFRRARELSYDHDDVDEQRRLLRAEFARADPEVAHLLGAVDTAPDLYLGEISQIQMESWSKGRVTLVGNAGYSSGMGMGVNTTIAVMGAYMLAHHLADHDDSAAAFRAYEDEMRPYLVRSRALGSHLMKWRFPRSRIQLALLPMRTRRALRIPIEARRQAQIAVSALWVMGHAALPELLSGDTLR